ncbi:MAG: DUF488 domain-containing protein [Cellulosilyticum sp.]|nr:DUF488 domain-containing protein [Cellulosilyticum sp.]
MDLCVYTIGYAHHTQESFLQLLKKYDIQCVIDVRTMAYSKFHPQFNKEPLKYFLNAHGILYRQMKEAFGIVRPESTLLNKEGYLDFKKIALLPEFKEGIEQILRGVKKGYRIVFMCAEKAPCDCHRSTLVGRNMQERGCKVLHILHDGSLETQRELEGTLLEMYYPENNQLDFFETSQVMKVDRAYELQSNHIVAVNGKRVLKDKYNGPK